jgi:hypothetical protein
MQAHCQHGQSAVLEHPAWPPPAPELEAEVDVPAAPLPAPELVAVAEPIVTAELAVVPTLAPPEPGVVVLLPREGVLHAVAMGARDTAPSTPRIRATS